MPITATSDPWHRSVGLALVISLATASAGSVARADGRYNSAEPGCDGSDPTILVCDDFEDANWYAIDCDHANSSGGLDQTQGWCGTIYANPITPEGAAVCGAQGAGGTDCAATSGFLDGHRGGGNMADHSLSPDGTTFREVYWRYYIKTSTDTVWSGEKMLTINHGPAGVGGIYFGGIGSGAGGSPGPGGAQLNLCAQYECNVLGTVFYRRQNQDDDLGIASNDHWYYVEIHIRINTPGAEDGAYDLWIDDCGADGLGCAGPGTLRAHHTDVQYVAPGDDNLIGSLWLENWGNSRDGGTKENDGTIGTHYYDQIVIATRRIGPMGVSIPREDGGIAGDADGGSGADAGARIDAGADTRSDGGATEVPDAGGDGGCGCRVAHGVDTSAAPWLAIGLALFARSRRHRRRRLTTSSTARRR